jgi:hypothetical protein
MSSYARCVAIAPLSTIAKANLQKHVARCAIQRKCSAYSTYWFALNRRACAAVVLFLTSRACWSA